MAEPLTTIQRVSARSSESIDTAEEIALAEEMIRAASGQVRFYGLPWADEASAPDIATDIATAAASRGYQNPSGFEKERGDSVTFERKEEYASGAELSRSEIAILKTFSSSQGIYSMPLSNPDVIRPRSKGKINVAWNAPVYDSYKPFPLGEGL